MPPPVARSLSHRERVAEGRVRDWQVLKVPHPALRATFSRWEKDLSEA